MPFRTGRVRLRTGTILGSRRHRRHFLLFGQQTLSDRLFRRRDRLDPAVRRRHAALDRHARRGGDRSEPQDGNLGRASRLAGPVRGRSHLLDRRRRLHAQALRRHPDEDSRRSGRAVVDRHAGHQPQRISLRREEGGFRVVARQRPRAARRSPRRVRHDAPARIQQEIRSAGRRHQREPSERLFDLSALRQQGSDRAAVEHLQLDRREERRLRLRSSGTARGVRRPYVEKLLLHRPPDIRPLPALPYPGRAGPERKPDDSGTQLAESRRLRRAHRPRRRPLRGTDADDRERQGARGDQARLPRQRRAAGKRPRAAPHLEVQGQGQRAAENIQARLGGMAAHEAQHEKGRQGHRPRADRAVREASGQPGLRLFARQLHAARAGSLVHLRGHARPANGHAARQAGHGKSRADGPAGLRRRRVRQDRNRDPRGLQGRHRLEARSPCWSPRPSSHCNTTVRSTSG